MTAPTHTLGRRRGLSPSLLLLVLLLRAVESSPSSSYRNAYIDSSGNAVNASRGGFSPLLPDDVLERKLRMQERRDRARDYLKNNPPPPPARKQLEKVGEEELRRLGWFGSGSLSTDLYSNGFLADPSGDYDKWAQAYRMLGGMIDCDHVKDQGSHDRNKNGNDNNNEEKKACSRWMLWAAYVNPNYQGNGYDEYYGDEPVSQLDCHNPNSEWVLLGVYRQEFYQFIEQISKHLWSYKDDEYVVAVAGLKYMTDEDCFQVGQTSSGTAIYGGVAPQAYGKFQMALYTDSYCLTPDTSLGMTYDDFGMSSDVNFGSKDNGGDDSSSWASDLWSSSQEYTLTNLNDVYDEFRYCTTCIDYPTYQDGYFIGNDGTDDDDLINQCWKFYSHDSYTCEAECIAKAHAQGTILFVDYGDTEFGKTISSFYTTGTSSVTSTAAAAVESPFQRLLANAALTASFLLFVATFLAFAVARRSRFRDARSSRSRRLLDDDEEGRSRKSKKSQRSQEVGDGLFKVERSSGKSKKSRSKSRSSLGKSPRKHKRSRSYEPPKEPRSRGEGRAGDDSYH